jgi:hypothetical protein
MITLGTAIPVVLVWFVIFSPAWIMLICKGWHYLRMAQTMKNPIILDHFQLQEQNKKLREYMELTRKAVMEYDSSKHDPTMAVMALETMRQLLKERSVEVVPTYQEKSMLKEIIMNLQKYKAAKGI